MHAKNIAMSYEMLAQIHPAFLDFTRSIKQHFAQVYFSFAKSYR